MNKPLPFWSSWKADLVAHVSPEQRPQSRGKWIALGLRIILTSPGIHLTWCYRLAHTLRGRAGLPGKITAALLKWWIRHWYFCDIAPSARLQGGLILPHPLGIVIAPDVEIGANSYVFQHVTVGGSPNRSGVPTIGPNARIYPGAVVAGPIRLGDSVWVGANAVVTRDVANQAVVRSGL